MCWLLLIITINQNQTEIIYTSIYIAKISELKKPFTGTYNYHTITSQIIELSCRTTLYIHANLLLS